MKKGFIQVLPLILLAAFAVSTLIIANRVQQQQQDIRSQAAQNCTANYSDHCVTLSSGKKVCQRMFDGYTCTSSGGGGGGASLPPAPKGGHITPLPPPPTATAPQAPASTAPCPNLGWCGDSGTACGQRGGTVRSQNTCSSGVCCQPSATTPRVNPPVAIAPKAPTCREECLAVNGSPGECRDLPSCPKITSAAGQPIQTVTGCTAEGQCHAYYGKVCHYDAVSGRFSLGQACSPFGVTPAATQPPPAPKSALDKCFDNLCPSNRDITCILGCYGKQAVSFIPGVPSCKSGLYCTGNKLSGISPCQDVNQHPVYCCPQGQALSATQDACVSPTPAQAAPISFCDSTCKNRENLPIALQFACSNFCGGVFVSPAPPPITGWSIQTMQNADGTIASMTCKLVTGWTAGFTGSDGEAKCNAEIKRQLAFLSPTPRKLVYGDGCNPTGNPPYCQDCPEPGITVPSGNGYRCAPSNPPTLSPTACIPQEGTCRRFGFAGVGKCCSGLTCAGTTCQPTSTTPTQNCQCGSFSAGQTTCVNDTTIQTCSCGQTQGTWVPNLCPAGSQCNIGTIGNASCAVPPPAQKWWKVVGTACVEDPTGKDPGRYPDAAKAACQAEATRQAQSPSLTAGPLPACGTGLNCSGNQLTGASNCQPQAGGPAYCCPIGQVISGTACVPSSAVPSGPPTLVYLNPNQACPTTGERCVCNGINISPGRTCRPPAPCGIQGTAPNLSCYSAPNDPQAIDCNQCEEQAKQLNEKAPAPVVTQKCWKVVGTDCVEDVGCKDPGRYPDSAKDACISEAARRKVPPGGYDSRFRCQGGSLFDLRSDPSCSTCQNSTNIQWSGLHFFASCDGGGFSNTGQQALTGDSYDQVRGPGQVNCILHQGAGKGQYATLKECNELAQAQTPPKVPTESGPCIGICLGDTRKGCLTRGAEDCPSGTMCQRNSLLFLPTPWVSCSATQGQQPPASNSLDDTAVCSRSSDFSPCDTLCKTKNARYFDASDNAWHCGSRPLPGSGGQKPTGIPTQPPATNQCQNGAQDRSTDSWTICECANGCSVKTDRSEGGGGTGWVCDEKCHVVPKGTRPSGTCTQIDFVHQGDKSYCGVAEINCPASCQTGGGFPTGAGATTSTGQPAFVSAPPAGGPTPTPYIGGVGACDPNSSRVIRTEGYGWCDAQRVHCRYQNGNVVQVPDPWCEIDGAVPVNTCIGPDQRGVVTTIGCTASLRVTAPANSQLLNGGRGITNNAAMDAGNFQVEGYCTNKGPVSQDNINWFCGSTPLTVRDYDTICQQTYSNLGAFAIQNGGSSTPAYNWRCYSFQ